MRASPSDDGDLKLAALLGDGLPAEAYIGPIRSGSEVVAMLYADNLPGGDPIGDTSAIEVILEHAGLLLDRDALRRALAQPSDSSPSPQDS